MSIAPANQSGDFVEASQPPKSRSGEWTWELVTMFPKQGHWTEDEYLSREFDGLVEYSNGVLEFLPMPTLLHQLIVDFLHSLLKQFVQTRSLGFTAFAPLRVRIGEDIYREPDVVYATQRRVQSVVQPLEGADLVMEVVSDSKDARERDLIEKRKDYATAGIPEYWIVDPLSETIAVLVLDKNEYQPHGEFGKGTIATSVLLPGFEIDVTACFEAGHAGWKQKEETR